jgi:REP element-mobilizing transposase RayT
MPCCLFTYHAYGSWMPDRKQGYVKRHQGVLPQALPMHRLYKKAMAEVKVEFFSEHQRSIIETLLRSQTPQRFDLHFVATDPTHVHALLAWRDERNIVAMRGHVKGSISRGLNAALQHRTWLSEGGSRKQVRNREHFDYLTAVYLPKHSGWKWSLAKGFHR